MPIPRSASPMKARACRRRISGACSAGSRGFPQNRPPVKARPGSGYPSSSASSTCMAARSLRTAPGPDRARLSPSYCPQRPRPDMSQNPHIIIVDDEAPAREMVGEYLKMHGFAVTLCDGGKSLRGAIDTGAPPDLVVLDLNMPEEDGLSIIRDLKGRTNVPVIMLTATASPIDRVVGLELGADDYIAKPCELRELMARIRSVLRRSTPVKAAAPTADAASASTDKDHLVRFGTKWLDLQAQALRDDEGN